MKNRKYLIAFFIAALVFLPWLLNDPFITHLGVLAATYAIVVMGLILFAGYKGPISIGHAAFFVLAAYISGILTKYGFPYLGAVSIATVCVGFLVFLVGVLVLRTSGHYLALASIAVAVIIQVLIKNSTITGGPSGLTAIQSLDIFRFRITDDLMYYYYFLICMIVGFVILQHIISSSTGDALQVIANNELAVQSLGIPVFRYKVMSFTISTLFAAFVGTLFAHYDGFIDPDRLGIYVSVLFLIMAFVGGIGNLYGSILGAFAMTIVEEYFQEFGQYNVLAYGLMLAIVIMFLPKWLVDLPKKLKLRKAK